MTLYQRIVAHLKNMPNQSDSDWGIMLALYPESRRASPGNGARITNIRRCVHRHETLSFMTDDSHTVSYTGELPGDTAAL